MLRLGFALVLSLSLLMTACTGLTLNENGPGGDGDGPSLGTYLENGSIAVDGRNENVFVLATETDRDTNVETKKLQVAGLSDQRARSLADLSGLEDLRIMFVVDGVMVMGERGVTEELILYNEAGTIQTDRVTTESRYHGTRIAGSGKWVAVADSNEDDSPVNLIRTSNLSVIPVPHGGDTLEANWTNTTDTLLGAVFLDPKYGTEPATGTLRFISWNMGPVAQNNFPLEADGMWGFRGVDVSIENADIDPFFSYSWVSVSPDDTYAVVPILHRYPQEPENHHRLALITLATGEVRLIDDAQGPVGFTPDGSAIVSYRSVLQSDETTSYHLLMIDPDTLEEELMAEPSPGLIQFFVTRDGNFVLVGDFFGSNELTVVDVDNGITTSLGQALDLKEFTSRPGTGEVYLVDEGLFRVDLFEATLEEVPLSFEPAHINRLPSDQLVVDNPATERLIFLDPDTGAINRSVSL